MNSRGELEDGPQIQASTDSKLLGVGLTQDGTIDHAINNGSEIWKIIST